ncbi:MAG TPA: 3-methyl-2-oxobutanoate hydroxymethyltransferase, partial [Pseudomonadota bacterium]|nr:3-methyl-2-oxobutanoate hydroxymethyltransferase [Pseudomonadota bacterium]
MGYGPGSGSGSGARAVRGSKVTHLALRHMKDQGERIAMVTAYDASFAALTDRAGVDLV